MIEITSIKVEAYHFRGKADIAVVLAEGLLMTQSGHWRQQRMPINVSVIKETLKEVDDARTCI